jgi:hypothetical protein
LGFERAGEALAPTDTLYPQKNGDPWAVRTQLIKQLAEPRPYELDAVNLAEYKGVRAPFDSWQYVSETCAGLSGHLTFQFAAELNTDPAAQQTRMPGGMRAPAGSALPFRHYRG